MGFLLSLFSKNKKNRNEENIKPEIKNTNENKDIKKENSKLKPKPKQNSVRTKIKKPNEEQKKKK